MRKSEQAKTELEMMPRPPGLFRRTAAKIAGVFRPTRMLHAFGRLMPSPLGLFMTLVWAGMTILVLHAFGAALMGPIGDMRKVMFIALALCVGLPFFIAPRWNMEPLAWGIGIDFFVMLALILLIHPTLFALEKYGHWMDDWLVSVQAPAPLKDGASIVRQFNAWAFSRLPLEKLEALSGPSREDEGSYEAIILKLKTFIDEEFSRIRRGEPVRLPRVEGVGDALVLDDVEARKEAAALSAETIAAQERRLFQLLNLERSRHSLPQLILRADLSAVARAQAAVMRDRKRLDTVDEKGRHSFQRVQEAMIAASGVKEMVGKADDIGEIARPLFDAILSEPVHRAWLTNTSVNYLAIGVGIACDGPTCYGDVLLIE